MLLEVTGKVGGGSSSECMANKMDESEIRCELLRGIMGVEILSPSYARPMAARVQMRPVWDANDRPEVLDLCKRLI